jgi:hypothetical protein
MRLYRALRYAPLAAVGLAVMAAARAVDAHPEGCAGPDIHMERQLSADWSKAVDQLATDLKVENDWDRCAVVTLLPSGSEVVVRVALQDGRAAMRRVHAPWELSSTVEAVLLVLPASSAHASAKNEEPARGEAAPPVSVLPRSNRDDRGVAHIELGLAGDARASGVPLFWGAGALFTSQVSLDGWLVAAEGHWDVFDTPVTIVAPAGFNMQTFAVGVGVGRRFESATLRADLLIGPELLVENEEADGAGEGLGGSTSDVRVHVTTHFVPLHAKPVRWFAALDADASPARIRHATRADPALPTSPAWSAGLGVGFLWEIR